MSPPAFRPGGRVRRSVAILLLLLVAGGVYGFRHLGTWMAPQDPLQEADAIFVLAGTVAERPLEAADLYKAGYAPVILVTRDLTEGATLEARRRGSTLPLTIELNRRMLLELGVPESALIIPDRIHDNTAQEIETLHVMAQQYHWRRVIVVSSKYHLRRIRFAIWREMRGAGVTVFLHGSRYDESDPPRWWTHRGDIRWLLSEVPKLLAYSLGLSK